MSVFPVVRVLARAIKHPLLACKDSCCAVLARRGPSSRSCVVARQTLQVASMGGATRHAGVAKLKARTGGL